MTESESQQQQEVEDAKQRKLDEFIEIRKSPSNTPPKRTSPAYQDNSKQTRLFNFTGEQPEKVLPPPLSSSWMQEEPIAKPIDDGKRQTRIDEFNKNFDSEFEFKKPKTKRQTLAPSTIFIPKDTNRRKSDSNLPRKGTPFPGRKSTGGFISASLINKQEKGGEEEGDSESEEYENQDDYLKKKSEKIQSKSAILQFIIGIIIMGVLLGIYGLFYEVSYPYPKGFKFCNSDNDPTTIQSISNNCHPCPLNGYCGMGRLVECEPNFVLDKELLICSDNKEITNYATSVVKDIQKLLSSQTGKFLCKESKKKGFTTEEIKNKIQEKLSLSEEKLDLVMDKLINLIKNSTKEFEINIEENVSNGNETNIIENIFYSENPDLSFGCRLTNKISEYKILILLIFLFILIIGILNIIKNKRTEERHKFEDLVTAIKTKLKDEKNCVMVHLRDSLNEEYGDQIDIESVWSDVEIAISKDSRILVKSDEQNGNIVWEWNSTNSTSTIESDLNRELFK